MPLHHLPACMAASCLNPVTLGSSRPAIFIVVPNVICLVHCVDICSHGAEAVQKTAGALGQLKSMLPNWSGSRYILHCHELT